MGGAHTLLTSGGDERFHTKAVQKGQRLEVPVKVEKRWQGESPSSGWKWWGSAPHDELLWRSRGDRLDYRQVSADWPVVSSVAYKPPKAAVLLKRLEYNQAITIDYTRFHNCHFKSETTGQDPGSEIQYTRYQIQDKQYLVQDIYVRDTKCLVPGTWYTFTRYCCSTWCWYK